MSWKAYRQGFAELSANTRGPGIGSDQQQPSSGARGQTEFVTMNGDLY